MPINDNATLVVGAGNYFTAVTDTAYSATGASPWVNMGHTSIEDILSFDAEGGEATVLRTLQNKALRTTYSTRTETMKFTLQQFDEASLKFFYGANGAVDVADGLFAVPNDPAPFIGAFQVVFIDGENIFALYIPKAEIFRADNLAIADTESLAGLPIGVKPMVSGSNTYTYKITPLGAVGDEDP